MAGRSHLAVLSAHLAEEPTMFESSLSVAQYTPEHPADTLTGAASAPSVNPAAVLLVPGLLQQGFCAESSLDLRVGCYTSEMEIDPVTGELREVTAGQPSAP
ncbi:hypothetical protein [Ideonella margarita]|uniref:Uncharacterized protein n=1 Tax=Ideonella margarita TaxID=2984191 RepID=A0ABU9C4J6_9BURK